MNEPYARDRLMPALLDRLTDEEPAKKTESIDDRVVTKSRLREIVLRDLNALFNAQAAFTAEEAENIPEHVMTSTLNYGISSLSGKLVSKLEMADLERMLTRVIQRFEPRIIPESVRVRGVVPDDPLGHHNELSFEISADMWSQPYPIELLLKTDLDLETGLVELSERGASAVGAIRDNRPESR